MGRDFLSQGMNAFPQKELIQMEIISSSLFAWLFLSWNAMHNPLQNFKLQPSNSG